MPSAPRTLPVVLILALATQTPPAARSQSPPARGLLEPGRHERTIEAAGRTWHYQAFVPSSAGRDRPLAVVLVLHGAGGSGQAYLDHAGWAAKAEKEGFLAIAPDGQPARSDEPPSFLLNPRLWNSGQFRPGNPRARIDDIAFFRALLDDVARRWPVDHRRVFVTGHSNGAGMAFRLGAELSDRFAALAPVASHCWVDDPKPSRALPTLYIIGTEDRLVPLEGGESTLPWGRRTTPPVAQTLARWSRALGCPDRPEESRPTPGLRVLTYPPGRDGATLTAEFIEGQGHNWPGGQSLLPERMVGPVVKTLNATDVIWDFFRQHPRPE
jgi:polyhydroxybutyrate depolymerase